MPGGQCIDLGMDVRFAQYIDNCIYSTWYNIAACIHPYSSHWLFYNWGFSKKLYHSISISHQSVTS